MVVLFKGRTNRLCHAVETKQLQDATKNLKKQGVLNFSFLWQFGLAEQISHCRASTLISGECSSITGDDVSN